jgi:hypothetical protein
VCERALHTVERLLPKCGIFDTDDGGVTDLHSAGGRGRDQCDEPSDLHDEVCLYENYPMRRAAPRYLCANP